MSAVTHPSMSSPSREDNQRLEFLGDRVLGLVMAEALLHEDKKATEGQMAPRFNALVRKETCADVARDIDLGAVLKLGRSEMKSGGRRKEALLADAMEAVIAAVFFDSDYNVARELVNRLLAEELRSTTPLGALDYKTMLQEALQAEKRAIPNYTVVKTEGPPHQRTFFVEAAWDKGKTSGKGNSIKTAEMEAACSALQEINKQNKKI